jgi:hypothetical protein
MSNVKRPPSARGNQHTAAVHQCFNNSALFTIDTKRTSHFFSRLREMPMPSSTSALSDEKLPLVNNGESTATRTTKISYTGNERYGATNSSATKRSGEQTTPASNYHSTLSRYLCASVSLFTVSPPPAAAPTEGQSLFAALVYCSSVF